MNDLKPFMTQTNLQTAGTSTDPLLKQSFESDPEVILERMHLHMDQVMKVTPVSSQINEPNNTFAEELPADRISAILLIIGILAGALLLIFTGF